MKVLITGGSGQLAQAFIRHLESNGIEYFAPTHKECDITDSTQLRLCIEEFSPDVLINCAAYNLVEQAEDEPEKANQANGDAVGIMAEICKDRGMFFIHFSSDYVFDGQKSEAYIEDDAVNPINAYGKSKLLGEQKIQEVQGKYLILRTSWVYGEGEQNFFHKLSQWRKKNDTLSIVTDEVSVPTFTEDIVEITFQAIANNLTGLYHLTNTGHCSRFDMAKVYFETQNDSVTLNSAKLADFESKVNRPHFSAMSNKKIVDELNATIPTWEEAIKTYVQKYVN